MDVHAHILPPAHKGRDSQKEIRGRIQNVSDGGICIMTSSALTVSSFVCCELSMLEVPVTIPTLMQVRWSARRGNANEHITGLRFVAN
jgi:hypothetical protein